MTSLKALYTLGVATVLKTLWMRLYGTAASFEATAAAPVREVSRAGMASEWYGNGSLMTQGAEAKVHKCTFLGRPSVAKIRFSKKYRHPELDLKLTHKRLTAEARTLARCRNIGINTPALYFVDLESSTIVLEHVDAVTLKQYIFDLKESHQCQCDSKIPTYPKSLDKVMMLVGKDLAKMHSSDIIHGDLTTSNILVQPVAGDGVRIIFIDFGLSSSSRVAEDKGVDLYVLEKAFLSTHPNSEALFSTLMDSYRLHWKNCKPVIAKFEEVKMRGRKRTMLG